MVPTSQTTKLAKSKLHGSVAFWSVSLAFGSIVLASSGCTNLRLQNLAARNQLQKQLDSSETLIAAQLDEFETNKGAGKPAALKQFESQNSLVSKPSTTYASTPMDDHGEKVVAVRAQDGGFGTGGALSRFDTGDQPRQPMAPTGTNPNAGPTTITPSGSAPAARTASTLPTGGSGAPAARTAQLPGDGSSAPGFVSGDVLAGPAPGTFLDPPNDALGSPQNFANIDALLEETQTGRFNIGAGFNSETGVTGNILFHEKNFDIRRVPRSWQDWVDGYAFRGAGQEFRVEAMPGNRVHHYMVSFADPYLWGTPVTFGASAFFDKQKLFDWQEQRLGGRLSLGYRLTPDISVVGAFKAQQVTLSDPRVLTVPELNEALGDSGLYTWEGKIINDTRDHPFAATEGYYLELSAEQTVGAFDFPKAEVDYRRYFLLRERPDHSGRHTLSYSTKVGFTGANTPIFENYFAGGFSTMRGFDYRGASPRVNTVAVGGEFRWLNTLEYTFPLTADDMIKGVAFCDFGTVEEKIDIEWDDFRVAPGFGFRVNLPFGGAGGAPLAFDFAFPVAMEDTDDRRVFSFYMGILR